MDGAAGGGDYGGVRVEVVREGDQGHGEGPAAASGPRGLFDGKGFSEDGAGVGREVVPGDHEVGGGVARGEHAEVYQGCQASVFDEEVAGCDVGVEADGVALPWGCPEGVLPGGGDSACIYGTFGGMQSRS